MKLTACIDSNFRKRERFQKTKTIKGFAFHILFLCLFVTTRHWFLETLVVAQTEVEENMVTFWLTLQRGKLTSFWTSLCLLSFCACCCS